MKKRYYQAGDAVWVARWDQGSRKTVLTPGVIRSRSPHYRRNVFEVDLGTGPTQVWAYEMFTNRQDAEAWFTALAYERAATSELYKAPRTAIVQEVQHWMRERAVQAARKIAETNPYFKSRNRWYLS